MFDILKTSYIPGKKTIIKYSALAGATICVVSAFIFGVDTVITAIYGALSGMI